MIERLFSLYNEELKFIREEVIEFGGRFNKVAERLRLAPDSIEDPHVNRLISSFALLTSKLRLKLADEFPEVCQSMLSALYPQYLAPIPSCAIAQFRMDSAGAALATGTAIPRGAQIETQEIDGQVCFYRTCFDVQVPPVQVARSEYTKPPFSFSIEPSWADRAEAAIRFDLSPYSNKLEWDKTQIPKLRLFLGGGNNCGNHLYEAFLRDSIGVGFFSDQFPRGIFQAREVIAPTGFDNDQGILDHDPRTQSAYRTLWEFFALPEKFRFIDISTESVWQKLAANNVSVVIYLGHYNSDLQKSMVSDAIQLGCTPVVNLFPQPAQAIQLTETQVENRVVPSYRTTLGMEVHTIESVTASRPGGDDELTFLPFFQPTHRLESKQNERYWHATRRRRFSDDGSGDRGTEVYLTLVDLNFRPHPEDDWILHVNTLCCNRDLVKQIGEQSQLQFGGGPVHVRFRTQSTPTLRPFEREEWVWRLISHLSLNHLSIASDSDGKLLREILTLYNCQEQKDVQKAISGILKVRYRRANAKLQGIDKGPGICRGLDIEMEIDEDKLESVGAYLMCSVLDRFFSTFASINSWTRLKVHGKSGKHVYSGVARSGSKILV
ncbi:MAG: type VI secretion system baseplate subunit TssF [Pirellula sp.]